MIGMKVRLIRCVFSAFKGKPFFKSFIEKHLRSRSKSNANCELYKFVIATVVTFVEQSCY